MHHPQYADFPRTLSGYMVPFSSILKPEKWLHQIANFSSYKSQHDSYSYSSIYLSNQLVTIYCSFLQPKCSSNYFISDPISPSGHLASLRLWSHVNGPLGQLLISLSTPCLCSFQFIVHIYQNVIFYKSQI